jgi:hypothetical protein
MSHGLSDCSMILSLDTELSMTGGLLKDVQWGVILVHDDSGVIIFGYEDMELPMTDRVL